MAVCQPFSRSCPFSRGCLWQVSCSSNPFSRVWRLLLPFSRQLQASWSPWPPAGSHAPHPQRLLWLCFASVQTFFCSIFWEGKHKKPWVDLPILWGCPKNQQKHHFWSSSASYSAAHPFSRWLHPFSKSLHPFSRWLHPFARWLHPFSRLLHPFSRLLHPGPFSRQLCSCQKAGVHHQGAVPFSRYPAPWNIRAQSSWYKVTGHQYPCPTSWHETAKFPGAPPSSGSKQNPWT